MYVGYYLRHAGKKGKRPHKAPVSPHEWLWFERVFPKAVDTNSWKRGAAGPILFDLDPLEIVVDIWAKND